MGKRFSRARAGDLALTLVLMLFVVFAFGCNGSAGQQEAAETTASPLLPFTEEDAAAGAEPLQTVDSHLSQAADTEAIVVGEVANTNSDRNALDAVVQVIFYNQVGEASLTREARLPYVLAQTSRAFEVSGLSTSTVSRVDARVDRSAWQFSADSTIPRLSVSGVTVEGEGSVRSVSGLVRNLENNSAARTTLNLLYLDRTNRIMLVEEEPGGSIGPGLSGTFDVQTASYPDGAASVRVRAWAELP